jgi:tripartite-type tricarboxylate transporter receptor subunit TctC
MMRIVRYIVAAALALGVGITSAWSQPYPSKPIRLVVGFAAGGSTDVAARLVAKRLAELLGQPVVVDNRPGAASNIAAQEVARAPADGYVLLYMTSTLAVNESLYPKLPFNLLTDFVAVAPVVDIPCVLSTHPSLPAKSLKELVALAKAQPGKISYASAGSGSATHLATELFASMAGIELLHIPYKGAAPAMADFLGGHVKVMFVCQVSQVRDGEKTGRLVPIAASSSTRIAGLPELPTVAESGLAGYEATVWNGILAPAGTPREIVARLNAAIAQAVKDQTPTMLGNGEAPMFATPEQFGAFLKSEVARWAIVVKRSGARPE